MTECEVCGDDAVGLFVCSSCANSADDKLRKRTKNLGRKEGARQELELFVKFYDRAWTFDKVNKYLKKRLKELEI